MYNFYLLKNVGLTTTSVIHINVPTSGNRVQLPLWPFQNSIMILTYKSGEKVNVNGSRWFSQ